MTAKANLILPNDQDSKFGDKNYLSIIENALWSMNALVESDKSMDLKIRDEYAELFNMALTKFQEIKKILES